MITEVKERNWYTVKVQNNREKSISEKIKSDMMRDYGMEIATMIPTRGIASVKNGKKVIKEQILYPGYVFVQTDSIDKVAHLVKSTPGASNVLRDDRGLAVQLKQSEIDRIIGEKEAVKAMIESAFVIGEKIEIISGPFSTFMGTVNWIDQEKNKVRVEVSIFGRSNLVDLTIDDINKISGE
jgi:transcriptional antiterminator NusG